MNESYHISSFRSLHFALVDYIRIRKCCCVESLEVMDLRFQHRNSVLSSRVFQLGNITNIIDHERTPTTKIAQNQHGNPIHNNLVKQCLLWYVSRLENMFCNFNYPCSKYIDKPKFFFISVFLTNYSLMR